MEAILSLGNDQQYLWTGVLQGHIGYLQDSCLFSIPCLDQLLIYKRSGSIFEVQAEWHDSKWECLMRIVQPFVDLLYEEVELIVKDKWVTSGICIWFCRNLSICVIVWKDIFNIWDMSCQRLVLNLYQKSWVVFRTFPLLEIPKRLSNFWVWPVTLGNLYQDLLTFCNLWLPLWRRMSYINGQEHAKTHLIYSKMPCWESYS